MRANASNATPPAKASGQRLDDTVWQGAVTGLVPLALLAVSLAATVVLTAVARQVTAPQGFFVQQQAAVSVLGLGLAVAAAAYVVACVRALRQVRAWQLAGKRAPTVGTLWALGITALVVAVPVILAVALPQSPAP
jgi:hypothetical protein